MLTRRAALLEEKLQATLTELECSKTTCRELLQERDDNEEEIKKVVARNTELKKELVEQHMQHRDIIDQHEYLRQIVSNYQQCMDTHEEALNRINVLERDLCDAHKVISDLQLFKNKEVADTYSLHDELIGSVSNKDNDMLVFIIISLVLPTAAGPYNIIKNVSKRVSNTVSTLTMPIAKTVTTVGFSQCKMIKKLFGMDHDSFNITQSEPDLSHFLEIDFINRYKRISYKLSMAAAFIPTSEWFNKKHPLKIYLHGFADDPTKEGFSTLSHAFLDIGDFNIVALNASSFMRGQYLRSTTMVRFIGQELGKLLAALVKAGLPPSSIHLIGHSLGSHISGFAGETFTSLTGHKVGRITGLDPARPCFTDVDERLRLNVNGADFVEAIHTNAGVYGMWDQVGHANYYPNGGSRQPGCSMSLASCSHSRAWLLFAESVRHPRAFVAINCPDWHAFQIGNCSFADRSLMGYGSRPSARGTYFLRTNDESPFGLGEEGVICVNS